MQTLTFTHRAASSVHKNHECHVYDDEGRSS